MDIKVASGIQTEYIKKYEQLTTTPTYNYSEEGVLKKCLPKILFKGNSVFVTFLQLIDIRIVMMLRYIDKLKQFKYISWY